MRCSSLESHIQKKALPGRRKFYLCSPEELEAGLPLETLAPFCEDNRFAVISALCGSTEKSIFSPLAVVPFPSKSFVSSRRPTIFFNNGNFWIFQTMRNVSWAFLLFFLIAAPTKEFSWLGVLLSDEIPLFSLSFVFVIGLGITYNAIYFDDDVRCENKSDR